MLLENVRGLVTHDEGRTLKTIIGELERIGYAATWKVISASPFVPQKRNRIYIVGVRGGPAFEFPEPPTRNKLPCIGDILEPNPDPSYTCKQQTWEVLQKHFRGGKPRYYIWLKPEDQARTLVCNDLHKQFVATTSGLPRSLTTRERLRVHGYPDSYRCDVSRSAGTKLTGNTVSPPVIRWIAEALLQLHPN